MARFYGRIGYGASVETVKGVYEDIVVERSYYGDVKRINRRTDPNGETVNDNLSVGNTIEIVADAYANLHFHAMKYVEWAGTRWIISSVDVISPRLSLRLGGVYHGPQAQATPAP